MPGICSKKRISIEESNALSYTTENVIPLFSQTIVVQLSPNQQPIYVHLTWYFHILIFITWFFCSQFGRYSLTNCEFQATSQQRHLPYCRVKWARPLINVVINASVISPGKSPPYRSSTEGEALRIASHGLSCPGYLSHHPDTKCNSLLTILNVTGLT